MSNDSLHATGLLATYGSFWTAGLLNPANSLPYFGLLQIRGYPTMSHGSILDAGEWPMWAMA